MAETPKFKHLDPKYLDKCHERWAKDLNRRMGSEVRQNAIRMYAEFRDEVFMWKSEMEIC